MASTERVFDIALSFAGENRETVEQIARCLRSRGVRVFYDEFEKEDLWGRDLQEHLTNVYYRWSRYAIIFVSQHYKEKKWARHELRAVLARCLEERKEYILPVRFDDTELDGLLPTVGYLDLRSESPLLICIRACAKLGLGQSPTKADKNPPPWSPLDHGTVTFNYSNHNGVYVIGKEPYLFETKWTKASNTRIYCYNDPQSIRGVALVPVGKTLADLPDGHDLDFTSRTRTPAISQFVVLENSNGFFAAIKIIDIKDDSRSDDRDELTFDYWILRDGSADFSTVDL